MNGNGIFKRTTFLGQDEYGEYVHLIDLDLKKYASKSEVYGPIKDYLEKSFSPEPGKTYLHVNAMGAMEAWGGNVNSDAFPEDDLIINHVTFRSHSRPYRQHKNKDPQRGLGRVIFSAYNPGMRRVELIVEVENNKAEDIVDSVNRGEFPRVSMGTKVRYETCFPKETLVRTEDGYKNIDQINVGDVVRTHTGENRAVVATMSRCEEDDLLEIDSFGFFRIKTTQNHPFFVVRGGQIRDCWKGRRRHSPDESGVCKYCGKQIIVEPEWVRADELTSSDFLVTPVDSCSEEVALGVDYCYLLGAFVGDGFIVKQKSGKLRNGDYYDQGIIVTSCFDDIEHIEKIEDVMGKCSITGHPNIYSAGSGRNAVNISLYDKQVAKDVLRLCGRDTRTKRLSEEMFNLSREEKLSFLAGYIDTDGHVDNKDGYIRICSINRGLLLDSQRLCHSVGIPAGVCVSHSSNKVEDAFVLYIQSHYLDELKKYSTKAMLCDVSGKRNHGRCIIINKYFLSPIKSISLYDGWTTVYNLQVDRDESYIVLGAAVHNCSICGNKNKTLQERCRHLRDELGRIYPDGRKVLAINRNNIFFDISFVIVPADRTASVIAKVASDGVSEPHEEIYNVSEGDLPIDEVGVPLPVRSLARVLGAVEPDLPFNSLESLCKFPIGRILATLGALGVVLKPKEFQSIILISNGKGDYARKLDKANISFDPGAQPVDVGREWADSIPDFDSIDDIGGLMIARSSYLPYAAKRLAMVSNGLPWDLPKSTRPLGGEIGDILSSLYSGYRASTLNRFDSLSKQLPAKIASISMVGDTVLTKEAMSPWARAAISFPASYLAAGYIVNKAKSGKPVNKLEAFIANHPALLGIAGTIGPGGFVYGGKEIGKALKVMGRDVKSAFREVKTAGDKWIDDVLIKEGGERIVSSVMDPDEIFGYIMSRVHRICPWG